MGDVSSRNFQILIKHEKSTFETLQTLFLQTSLKRTEEKNKYKTLRKRNLFLSQGTSHNSIPTFLIAPFSKNNSNQSSNQPINRYINQSLQKPCLLKWNLPRSWLTRKPWNRPRPNSTTLNRAVRRKKEERFRWRKSNASGPILRMTKTSTKRNAPSCDHVMRSSYDYAI